MSAPAPTAELQWTHHGAPAAPPPGNPAPAPGALAAAVEAYRWTHGGREPDRNFLAPVACAVDAALAALGVMVAIEYLANKGDGLFTYRHLYESEPPTLAADVETRALHFVGGLTEITAHGVEDRFGRRQAPLPGSVPLGRTVGTAFGRRVDAPAPGTERGAPLAPAPRSSVGGATIDRSAARCPGPALAALGPLVALEWRDDAGVVRRHEFGSRSAPLLTFDRTTNLLHVVMGAYTVDSNGVLNTMSLDPHYATIANPGMSPFGSAPNTGLAHSHMRDNPGVLVTREELPDHEPGVIIGGTLIAIGVGLAIAMGMELVLGRFVARSPRLALALRFLGVVAGVGVAFYYPVIGAAIGGASALGIASHGYANWSAILSGERPAAGLEVGGLFTPYPTGAFAAA